MSLSSKFSWLFEAFVLLFALAALAGAAGVLPVNPLVQLGLAALALTAGSSAANRGIPFQKRVHVCGICGYHTASRHSTVLAFKAGIRIFRRHPSVSSALKHGSTRGVLGFSTVSASLDPLDHDEWIADDFEVEVSSKARAALLGKMDREVVVVPRSWDLESDAEFADVAWVMTEDERSDLP